MRSWNTPHNTTLPHAGNRRDTKPEPAVRVARHIPISATRTRWEASRFSGDFPLMVRSTHPPRIGEGRVSTKGLFAAGGGLLDTPEGATRHG